uniref:SFRICE_013771 n=1 Tax=Spodoptera frugiperda TaxID=7108 RepID=A0A2H1W6N3_SPOFR
MSTSLYPRRGRQCTLWHLIPLHNVHPLFTILCYKSHVIGVILGSTWESNLRPHLRPARQDPKFNDPRISH